MSDETKDAAKLAKEQAAQAGHQTRAAAKNAGKAARSAAEPVVEGAKDTVEDAVDAAKEKGQDTVHLVQKSTGAVAEFAVDEFQDAKKAARRVDVSVLSRMSGDTGVGFLALSVCLYSGAVAFAKFRKVAQNAHNVT